MGTADRWDKRKSGAVEERQERQERREEADVRGVRNSVR